MRRRKTSESCLDTTSVGRVRTHSGCNPSGSPFPMPFSPPMSPYIIYPQSPASDNVVQEQLLPVKTTDKIICQPIVETSGRNQPEKLQHTQDYPS